ncbi:MAG TPA: DivIVA domain-containing protein [Acidimicrobiales bacterium]|nr:DivIVA domain-containing protein [Acidimicrobiales bacterium]
MSTIEDFEVDDQLDDIRVVDEPVDESASARIRTARFREKLRGYHPDDVDGFLEQLSLLVGDLEAQLADATGRLDEAQQRTTVATVNEQTVRRTLVLAQRTAELAVTEAQSRAAAIVAEAEEQARSRVAAVEAEVQATREVEEARLRDDLARLEEARAEAERDLAELANRRAEEHARLTEALGDLASVVDARLR